MNENRVFELRVYTANEGKLEALKARFRDHTTALFNKHHMEVIGYWSPQDPDKAKDMFIYILAHPSRADAEKNWNAFKGRPRLDFCEGWFREERRPCQNHRVDVYGACRVLTDEVVSPTR